MDKILMRKRCEVLVIALVGENLSNRWWNSYNKAFNMTANEQYDIDPKVVYDYLMHYGFGGW